MKVTQGYLQDQTLSSRAPYCDGGLCVPFTTVYRVAHSQLFQECIKRNIRPYVRWNPRETRNIMAENSRNWDETALTWPEMWKAAKDRKMQLRFQGPLSSSRKPKGGRERTVWTRLEKLRAYASQRAKRTSEWLPSIAFITEGYNWTRQELLSHP